MSKAKRRPKQSPVPGDIFAIPRRAGGYYMVCLVASNRFGDAFGAFEGHHERPTPGDDWKPVAWKYPQYSGNRAIRSGRWTLAGRREDLLDLFPQSPEIFHSKQSNLDNNEIGPHGSGETADGRLRNLSAEEAKEIDIDRTYRQIMVEEQFEDHLNHRLG